AALVVVAGGDQDPVAGARGVDRVLDRREVARPPLPRADAEHGGGGAGGRHRDEGGGEQSGGRTDALVAHAQRIGGPGPGCQTAGRRALPRLTPPLLVAE